MLPSTAVSQPRSTLERRRPAFRLALTAVAAALVACGVNLNDVPGRACDDTHPCREGRACLDGFCFAPDELDAGVDAGPFDAGSTDDAGAGDAGAGDAGVLDAGAQPLWRQKVHGFTGITVDTNCSVDIDPSRNNRVLATISSTDDARDTATADMDTAGRLPGVAWGRVRGLVTLPAPLGLRGRATFASIDTSDGRAWLRLAFDAQGRLLVQSDATTLASTAMNEAFTRDGGFPAGDYSIDVTWDRSGARRVALDGVILAETPVASPGGSLAPAVLHLGVVDYGGDAGSGWSVTLSGWEAADDPRAVLGDAP